MFDLDRFLLELPKVELHVHIEGTLEPELLFELAARNEVTLPFRSVEEARRAYDFRDLQSFLDVYYEAAKALLHEQDFHDLAWAYLARAAREGVRHAEIFFDPQTHTDRGVPVDAVIRGLTRACDEARERLSVTTKLILCFLRHLPPARAMRTLEEALPWKDRIVAVGLDSSEVGNPPREFASVFERARREGFLTVAHAGEEGPPAYVWEALDLLHVSRIDHGVRSIEDPRLIERLVLDRIPLTVCPLSNVKLRVFRSIEDHVLPRLLERGVVATVNSDDPAYFGGYILANYEAVARGLGLPPAKLGRLARNAIEASFLDAPAKARLESEVEAVLLRHGVRS